MPGTPREDRPAGAPRRGLAACCLALLAVLGCTGDGSDIGPDADRLPELSYVVPVADADGRPVCNAVVRVDGAPEAVTGRSGRADLQLAPPRALTVDVDATLAAASAGDALASLRFAVHDGFADEPGFVVHLPDLRGSSGLTLDAGVLAAPARLDDRGASGVLLDFAAGSRIEFGGAARATLRSGALPADRAVPLRTLDGRQWRAGSVAVLDPPAFRATPGGALSLPNDLGLAAGTVCDLLATDPQTGDWRRLGAGRVGAAGDRIVAGASADAGGSYAFAVPAAATTAVDGRVVSPVIPDPAAEPGDPLPEPRPLADVLVRCGSAVARTGNDGRFRLAGIAATDATGAPRALRVDVVGGRFRLPGRATATVDAVPGGVADAGDVTLDAEYAGLLRMLLIERGTLARLGAVGISNTSLPFDSVGIAGAEAQLDVPDVPFGTLSFLRAVPSERRAGHVLAAQALRIAPRPARVLRLRLFAAEEFWVPGGGVAELWTAAARGGGMVRGADVWRRGVGFNSDAFVGTSSFANVPRAEIDDGEASAVLATASADGRRAYSAFSVRRVRGGRAEMPLERVDRAPHGAFRAHVLVRGSVPGAGGERRVAGQVPQNADTWLAGALTDRPLTADVPRPLEPGAAATFTVGVPLPGGALVAVSGTPVGARLRADRLAIDRRPPADRSVIGSAQFDVEAAVARELSLPRALVGRAAVVDPAALAVDLAVEFPDGSVAEVGRDLANVAADAPGARLRVPALDGGLEGARYLAVVVGRGTGAAGAVVQRAVHRLDAAALAGAAPAVELLPPPELVRPRPGVVLPAGGFEVELVPPPDALYTTLRLRGETADELRDWLVLLPGDATSFRFRHFPDGPAVLAPGDYTLTAESVRVDGGPLLELRADAYEGVVARYLSIGPDTRREAARASRTIEVRLVE